VRSASDIAGGKRRREELKRKEGVEFSCDLDDVKKKREERVKKTSSRSRAGDGSRGQMVRFSVDNLKPGKKRGRELPSSSLSSPRVERRARKRGRSRGSALPEPREEEEGGEEGHPLLFMPLVRRRKGRIERILTLPPRLRKKKEGKGGSSISLTPPRGDRGRKDCGKEREEGRAPHRRSLHVPRRTHCKKKETGRNECAVQPSTKKQEKKRKNKRRSSPLFTCAALGRKKKENLQRFSEAHVKQARKRRGGGRTSTFIS